MISLIETVQVNKNTVFVRAVVEDMVEIYPATQYDPPEYGPAVCETEFELNEDEVLPENDEELIDYLNELSLDWLVLDKDWNYQEKKTLTPYYLWVIVFGIFAYFIAVDQSIATYVVLLWKQSRLAFEKYKWWLMNNPRNPIIKYMLDRKYLKLAKELEKEMKGDE